MEDTDHLFPEHLCEHLPEYMKTLVGWKETVERCRLSSTYFVDLLFTLSRLDAFHGTRAKRYNFWKVGIALVASIDTNEFYPPRQSANTLMAICLGLELSPNECEL